MSHLGLGSRNIDHRGSNLSHQAGAGLSDFKNGAFKRRPVCFRWFLEARDLSDELQSRATQLLRGGRCVCAPENFDASTHSVEQAGKSGATRQNRTDDPLITNEMLYQLS